MASGVAWRFLGISWTQITATGDVAEVLEKGRYGVCAREVNMVLESRDSAATVTCVEGQLQATADANDVTVVDVDACFHVAVHVIGCHNAGLAII